MSMPEDRLITQMVIPVSKETFFNTQSKTRPKPLCPYDMLYHPPDYNPKAARSDRQEPKIIKRNIWEQERHKIIPSTTHFQLGRPTIKILDVPTKQFVRVQVKNENPHMRIYSVLEWAILLNEGKPSLCD
ncbi:uncharacterized protein LOC123700554 [Colias croceus]|uniref:uncharacterized protein LOC119834559 n=1 Tax=Zerene cesonia TaxID=33412 RepID=UPI0018E56D28|nr:uncharacterized protein LOC119834559 [Zerene cesonia]XP_045503759.1 uncharacterized protein LOC123700554 [Colias croceus]CAG4933025.1 unnamed protein product [Colias eurytheme]